MSQQPPGPTGDSDPDRTPQDGEPTESFGRSPYDVPETDPQEETAAYPAAAPYGQAPDPSRTIYSDASTTEPGPDPEPEGRRRWVLPVVVAVVILLVAGGVAAALLLGGDDTEDPAPAAPTTTAAEEATTPAAETTAPTEEPTDAATTAEPTPEPTTPEEPSSELLEDLVETVTAEEVTFYLSDEGFVPEPVEGAVEAYRGTYAAGETEIGMLATLWPDNAAADAFAAQLLEGLDGREIATGTTYTNDAGTYWAYIIVEDGEERGTYVWTTDRGHVLQIVGTLDWVDRFYDSFPL